MGGAVGYANRVPDFRVFLLNTIFIRIDKNMDYRATSRPAHLRGLNFKLMINPGGAVEMIFNETADKNSAY